MQPLIKHYHTYIEMINDFGKLSEDLDVEATIQKAPAFSFITKDGRVHLGGTFQIFLVKLVSALGIKVLPMVSFEMPGVYAVNYEDYSPVIKEVKDESIQVKPVDSAARKRSQRAKS